ncbi:hypothetical protein SNEBB_004382 [Seison nebaliae]|nr:hypothetical protein SNEBB_004382 [Seison nebaliae]
MVVEIDGMSDGNQEENNDDKWPYEEKVKGNDHVKIYEMILYGIGGLPYELCANAIGFYITAFLLEVAQIRAVYASAVVFAAKVFDAITDPLTGMCVSATNSKYGRTKPWVLGSTIPAIFCYLGLWYVPDGWSQHSKVMYYIFFNCAFGLFLSLLHVPYTTMVMYVTNNSTLRDRLTAFRMIFEAFGILASVVTQGLIIRMSGGSLGECDTDGNTTTNSLEKTKKGYIYAAIFMGTMYFICVICITLGVKERIRTAKHHISQIGRSVKLVLSHRPYQILVGAYVMSCLSIQTVQGCLILYCKYVLHAEKHFDFICITLIASAVVSQPLWYYLMGRIGKKPLWMMGCVVLGPCAIVLFYLENISTAYVVFIIAGMTIGINFLVPWSMLPDVLDNFVFKYEERHDPIFYSFFVFITKFSAGIALAVSQLVLEYVGKYEAGRCEQPPTVGKTLRYIVVPGPFIFNLICIIFLWRYPLTSSYMKKVNNKVRDIPQNHENTSIKDYIYNTFT